MLRDVPSTYYIERDPHRAGAWRVLFVPAGYSTGMVLCRSKTRAGALLKARLTAGRGSRVCIWEKTTRRAA